MLRNGKLKENALKRSILKEIKSKRKEIIEGSGIGNDATVVDLGYGNDANQFAISTDSVTISCNDSVYYAIMKSINNLAVKGANPIGVLLTILLPESSEEAIVKTIMRQAEITASSMDIQIAGGHTEVSKAVNYPVISVTSFGKIKSINHEKGKINPGDDIVLTKWIGLEGTAIIASENRSTLDNLFPKAFVEQACKFRDYVSIREEAEVANDFGISTMHDASTGGIFGALWEISEGSKVGLEIDLNKIPIRQETVELCEEFGINPYELVSGGCLIIACCDGNGLVEKLAEREIPAVIIGKATDKPDRIIRNDEEIRYLEMPKADEILKIMN